MGDRGDVVKLAYSYADQAVKHELFDKEFSSTWAAEIYEASQCDMIHGIIKIAFS